MLGYENRTGRNQTVNEKYNFVSAGSKNYFLERIN
jgi:uncharacterized protein YmfQ (DUF2313 family)